MMAPPKKKAPKNKQKTQPKTFRTSSCLPFLPLSPSWGQHDPPSSTDPCHVTRRSAGSLHRSRKAIMVLGQHRRPICCGQEIQWFKQWFSLKFIKLKKKTLKTSFVPNTRVLLNASKTTTLKWRSHRSNDPFAVTWVTPRHFKAFAMTWGPEWRSDSRAWYAATCCHPSALMTVHELGQPSHRKKLIYCII